MLGWYFIRQYFVLFTFHVGLGYYNRARNLHKCAQLVYTILFIKLNILLLNRLSMNIMVNFHMNWKY